MLLTQGKARLRHYTLYENVYLASCVFGQANLMHPTSHCSWTVAVSRLEDLTNVSQTNLKSLGYIRQNLLIYSVYLMSEMCEGQYMGARWYGISSWVFNLISSSWAREEKFKHTNDHFFHDFRQISEHFPKISEDSLEVGGRPKNLFRKFSENARKDCRR